MKIKGLTLQQIEQAAREAGHFRLDNVRQIGNYTFFVLRMASGTPTASERKWFDRAHSLTLNAEQDEKYRSIATRMEYRKRGTGRMMWGKGPEFGTAVCFHGFKAFMDRCFDLNENAIIRTTQAAYLGREDFDRKWPSVGMKNIGSQAYPVQYRECCDCYGA